jgi:hypothetical protein
MPHFNDKDFKLGHYLSGVKYSFRSGILIVVAREV